MIVPTIGALVLVHLGDSDQAVPGWVTYVHSDILVNIGGFDKNGVPFYRMSMELLQEDEQVPFHPLSYAEYKAGKWTKDADVLALIARQAKLVADAEAKIMLDNPSFNSAQVAARMKLMATIDKDLDAAMQQAAKDKAAAKEAADKALAMADAASKAAARKVNA